MMARLTLLALVGTLAVSAQQPPRPAQGAEVLPGLYQAFSEKEAAWRTEHERVSAFTQKLPACDKRIAPNVEGARKSAYEYVQAARDYTSALLGVLDQEAAEIRTSLRNSKPQVQQFEAAVKREQEGKESLAHKKTLLQQSRVSTAEADELLKQSADSQQRSGAALDRLQQEVRDLAVLEAHLQIKETALRTYQTKVEFMTADVDSVYDSYLARIKMACRQLPKFETPTLPDIQMPKFDTPAPGPKPAPAKQPAPVKQN
jgi:hypothetical protein